MAKRPFKKYNSRDSIDAVQLTEENIESVRVVTRGEIQHELGMGEPVLVIPTLPSNVSANLGDFIVDDEGRWKVYLAEDFEQHYRVPKAGTDETEVEDEE